MYGGIRRVPFFLSFKGRPKLFLCVTTVEHCRFHYLFYIFKSCVTNHRRQKCAFVISLEMKTAIMQQYYSGKWFHCRHGVFQTRFDDFNVDLKLINSFFAANEMQISRNSSENVNYKYFGIKLF